MGYNTALLIINDGLGEIESNPKEFISKLTIQISKSTEGYFGVGQYCNQVKVMKTEHSNFLKLFISQHNEMNEISKFNSKVIDRCKESSDYKNLILNQLKDAENKLKDFKEIIVNL